MPKNDWNEYKKLILHEMKENGRKFEHISDILDIMAKDISTLKVKAAIAGGVAGLVGTGIVTMVLSAFK